MAEKTINTRILLKYDTYANWVSNNPILKAGELAIATISTGNTQEVNSVATPQVLIKVGDGTTSYTALPFVSARAADVYSWAKASTKPTYSASEITGLSDYIAGEIEDTDTQYQVVKGADDYTYKLQSKAKGATTWADVSTITIPKYDDTAVKADISALENLVGETAVATQIANAISALNLSNTYELKGTAATEAGKVQTALNNYKNSNDAVISAIKDGTTIDSFKDVETALAGKQDSGDYATKTEAQGYANAKDAAIAAAKEAGDNAQADVDALAATVGEVEEGKTVVEMISDAQAAATYDDTALSGRVTTVEGKVNTLVGSDSNKSARTIASEEVAKIVAGADTAYDTLKEIADWIASHKTDATAMNSAITALEGIVDGIGGDGEKATVVEYVTDAISALKIGDYAKAADLTALAGRVSTLEGKSHTHTNKTVIDGITSDKVTHWDNAYTNMHTHSNKTVLDGITSAKVSAWDKVSEKANDADLAAIAKSGNVNDLVQTAGDVLIFNCGNSNF